MFTSPVSRSSNKVEPDRSNTPIEAFDNSINARNSNSSNNNASGDQRAEGKLFSLSVKKVKK